MEIGSLLNNRYTVTERLGKGAMGSVYRARDQQSGLDVALKMLATDLTFDPDMLQRFRREGEALKQLRHPNIVSFVDMFEFEGQQVIVMEYVPGGSLFQLMRRGSLAVAQARHIALDLCDALTRAHRLNIIHRDIKPENVLIAEDGTPKLSDFGVARLLEAGTRLTGTGTQVGTPFYMSPEAWQGRHLDAQADIWSLGVVLYEMLTGQVPFGGETMAAVMNKVLTAPLPDIKAARPDVPSDLARIIRKMLARDQGKRYQTMREVALDLERVTKDEVTVNQASQTRIQAGKGRRAPTWLIGAVVLGLLIVAGLAAAGGIAMWALNNAGASSRATQAALRAELRATQTALLPTQSPQPSRTPAASTPTPQAAATPLPSLPAPTATPPATSVGSLLPGQALNDAMAGKFRGTKVTVLGTFGGNEITKFDTSVKDFEDRTGIDIQYEQSTGDLGAVLSTRIAGGDPPDIVDFPQAGLLGTFAKAGEVLDLNKIIDPAWLKTNYAQSWLDIGTMPGPNGLVMAGVWSRVSTKSLVWYPKAEFDKAGYSIPQTWDELVALSDQIAKTGGKPWCIGMESGAATGWPMTDWIEEAMLRTTSLENYDKWVAGTLKFDSPEVRKAVDVVTQIWFNDQYVYGGRKSIVTTYFGDSVKPMFDKPPKCWLHKQADWIVSFFPEGLKAGVDYDFFYLPPIDPQFGKPVLVGGDIYGAFNDRPEVRAVIQYFSTGDSVKGWVEAGGAISPHNDASLDWYQDPVTRRVAETIQNATSIRFDGSDLMPGVVGAGTFWKEMTAFVSGSIDENTALKAIDASWPK